jgi:hypothetical protein
MKKTISWLTMGSLLLSAAAGNALAQDDADEAPKIVPVEIYVCNFNEGKGPADLDNWSDKWKNWAETEGTAPYSGYTLTPFYHGDDQDFDFIWLGVSPDMTSMGRGYDEYFVKSGSLAGEFAAMADCSAHSNFATMNIKQPPDDDATSFVLSFSDCTIEEGKNWSDAYAALSGWAEYRDAHGSNSGMWVMWPAYGGGKVEFDFKFLVSHRSLEHLGADWDQYASGGYEKADELFNDVLDCDISRAYLARERRDGIPDDD